MTIVEAEHYNIPENSRLRGDRVVVALDNSVASSLIHIPGDVMQSGFGIVMMVGNSDRVKHLRPGMKIMLNCVRGVEATYRKVPCLLVSSSDIISIVTGEISAVR